MYSIYQIMPDDTLEKIAQMTNTTKENLMMINGLNTTTITPGNYIVVPMNITLPFSTYTVKKSDSIYEIAQKNNVDYQTLLSINGLNKDDYIYPEQEIIIPNKDFNIYVTRANDSLTMVADELGANPEEIIRENATIYLQPEQLIIYKK